MGDAAIEVAQFDADRWQEQAMYRWAIQLFNDGYYWEAHECWEAVWHAVGRHGTVADLLKGLIKLAAAGVKARQGRLQGVRTHAVRACQLFRDVIDQSPSDRLLGLDLRALLSVAQQLAEQAADVIDTSDRPVVVVMPFRLLTEPLAADEDPLAG